MQQQRQPFQAWLQARAMIDDAAAAAPAEPDQNQQRAIILYDQANWADINGGGDGEVELMDADGQEAVDVEEMHPAEGEGEEDMRARDPYYYIMTRRVPGGDIYQATRVGDLQRVRQLVEGDGVDVNVRDRWDSVPLYYACLAGHMELVEYLLQAGAVCNEYTFDGDRCHYAALHMGIRTLLRRYEARPPPLGPLAESLRTLSALQDNPEAPLETRAAEPAWCDFAFHIAGERIPLHRALLAARSPYFRRMLATDWLPRQRGCPREVRLVRPELSAPALKSVLAYLYTERLDVAMPDVAAVLQLARKCRLRAVEAAIHAELRTLKYYFKTTRKEDKAPRRFVLQPGNLPPSSRLAADLDALRRSSARLAARPGAAACTPASDFADLVLQVDGRRFRVHRCILAARSEYFRALFQRTQLPAQDTTASAHSPHSASPRSPEAAARTARTPASASSQPSSDPASPASPSPPPPNPTQRDMEPPLPELAVADVGADVFELVLEYIYSDRLAGEPGRMTRWASGEQAARLFDAADRYLIFPMKRVVAEALVALIEPPPLDPWDPAPVLARPAVELGLEETLRLLLAGDMYSVQLLRRSCLQYVAAQFDVLASPHAPEGDREVFQAFIAAVAPKDGRDLLDGRHVLGASRGNIEGGGLGGLGVGTLLQDLREAYLESFGEEDAHRDSRAKHFDSRLLYFADKAFNSPVDEET